MKSKSLTWYGLSWQSFVKLIDWFVDEHTIPSCKWNPRKSARNITQTKFQVPLGKLCYMFQLKKISLQHWRVTKAGRNWRDITYQRKKLQYVIFTFIYLFTWGHSPIYEAWCSNNSKKKIGVAKIQTNFYWIQELEDSFWGYHSLWKFRERNLGRKKYRDFYNAHINCTEILE